MRQFHKIDSLQTFLLFMIHKFLGLRPLTLKTLYGFYAINI